MSCGRRIEIIGRKQFSLSKEISFEWCWRILLGRFLHGSINTNYRRMVNRFICTRSNMAYLSGKDNWTLGKDTRASGYSSTFDSGQYVVTGETNYFVAHKNIREESVQPIWKSQIVTKRVNDNFPFHYHENITVNLMMNFLSRFLQWICKRLSKRCRPSQRLRID